MFNPAGQIKPKLGTMDKRFVRSRSRSQSNPADSPRSCFSTLYSKTFFPRYIPEGAKSKPNSKENRLSQVLGDECSNSLPMKLKIMQLEEQLHACQSQKAKAQTEVLTLKGQLKVMEELRRLDKSGNNKENEQRQEQVSEIGNQNLKKLRKSIAESRLSGPIQSIQKLTKENNNLSVENQRLKNNVALLECTLKQLRKNSQGYLNEHPLQDTVLKLQKRIRGQEEQNRSLDLRMKILLAKEVKEEHQKNKFSKEDFQELKMKHMKLIKQHNFIKKELISLRQIQKGRERASRLATVSDFRSREVSLSFSPEEN